MHLEELVLPFTWVGTHTSCSAAACLLCHCALPLPCHTTCTCCLPFYLLLHICLPYTRTAPSRYYTSSILSSAGLQIHTGLLYACTFPASLSPLTYCHSSCSYISTLHTCLCKIFPSASPASLLPLSSLPPHSLPALHVLGSFAFYGIVWGILGELRVCTLDRFSHTVGFCHLAIYSRYPACHLRSLLRT